MRGIGVICEFNPFHAGHAHLLTQMRAAVGDGGCVVALMSGRFAQRGTVAVADPYRRADMALAGGADLVVELPFPWSAGSAEHFATAGIRLLTRLGVDTVAFGSEWGDGKRLCRAAEAVDDPRFGEIYAAEYRGGMGTTAAYTEAIRTLMGYEGGQNDGTCPASNDLLGIAYLRALKRIESEAGRAPAAMIVPRQGSGYRDEIVHAGEYPSATAIRRLIDEASGDPDTLEAMLNGTMPDGALHILMDAIRKSEAPLSGERLWDFYHVYYRLQRAEAVAHWAECGGGIAEHIIRQAMGSATAADFWCGIRTKQYTDARLRRAMLFGATGVTVEDLRMAPTYTTLLAANARGCAYLRHLHSREAGELVITKPADAPHGRQSELCGRADALFTLCFPTPHAAGDMLRRTPVIRE